MGALKIISYVALSVLVVVAVQVKSAPVENNWLVDATNSIKESASKVESYTVRKHLVKMITDESFDNFTSVLEISLTKMIEQVDNMKSEEGSVLKSKLTKWLEDLRKINNESEVAEKPNDKTFGKFLQFVDYVSKEVIGFDKNYNFESSESKQFIEQLKSSAKIAVSKLVERVKYIETHVPGIIGGFIA